MRRFIEVVIMMLSVNWGYSAIWEIPGNFEHIQDAFDSDSVESGDTSQVHPGY